MKIVVNLLAAYRIICLVQTDSITLPLRERFVKAAKYTRYEWLTPLTSCPWCLSIWVGGLVLAGNAWGGFIWWSLARILAVAAIAGFMAYYHKMHFR